MEAIEPKIVDREVTRIARVKAKSALVLYRYVPARVGK
jgi:hypothetical protein